MRLGWMLGHCSCVGESNNLSFNRAVDQRGLRVWTSSVCSGLDRIVALVTALNFPPGMGHLTAKRRRIRELQQQICRDVRPALCPTVDPGPISNQARPWLACSSASTARQ